jgi:hypothetical protein
MFNTLKICKRCTKLKVMKTGGKLKRIFQRGHLPALFFAPENFGDK